MAEPDDDQALRAKLDALKGALERRSAEKRAGEAAGPSESERAATASAISLGLRAASEFAAAIVVGGLIGWQLDRWLGTKPAFLIVVFSHRHGGRRLERHPGDFAQRPAKRSQFELVWRCGAG